MELSFGRKNYPPPPPAPSDYAEDSSPIGSDRLQKAIERNRAKQLKREAQQAPRRFERSQEMQSFERNVPPQPGPRNIPTHSTPMYGNSMGGRPVRNLPGDIGAPTAHSSTIGTNRMRRPSDHLNTPVPTNPRTHGFNRFENRYANQSMPEARNTGYQSPVKRTTGLLPSNDGSSIIGRAKSAFSMDTVKEKFKETFTNTPLNITSNKSELSEFQKKAFDWLIKVGWGFCIFLVLRLIFSERGIIDYTQRLSSFEENTQYLTSLRAENEKVLKEIDLIRNDSDHQKKLVRKHLGYISDDEFMILFAGEK